MKIFICSFLLFAVFGGLISLPLDSGLEDTIGSDMALVKNGSRVVRGKDWIWGDQDGGVGSLGTAVDNTDSAGWIRVKWDGAGFEKYRMGFEGKYDLQVAPPSSRIARLG